jgi:hypothetical protein
VSDRRAGRPERRFGDRGCGALQSAGPPSPGTSRTTTSRTTESFPSSPDRP